MSSSRRRGSIASSRQSKKRDDSCAVANCLVLLRTKNERMECFCHFEGAEVFPSVRRWRPDFFHNTPPGWPTEPLALHIGLGTVSTGHGVVFYVCRCALIYRASWGLLRGRVGPQHYGRRRCHYTLESAVFITLQEYPMSVAEFYRLGSRIVAVKAMSVGRCRSRKRLANL